VDEVWDRPAEPLVTAFMVVEIEVPSQAALRFMEVSVVTQVDLLVFHAAPQTLDEDVVETAGAAVHADADLGLVEPAGEVMVRRLFIVASVLMLVGLSAGRAVGADLVGEGRIFVRFTNTRPDDAGILVPLRLAR